MDEITRTHEDTRGVLSEEEILAAEDACRTLMGELSEHRGRLVATRSETACARCLRAGSEGITYFCIQTKAGSLEHFTSTDGELCPDIKAF